MPEHALNPIPFVFGKLPSHGDFIARGLSATEISAWDDALATSLEAARREFGEDFERRYAQAPPWRFFVEVGHSWMAGAIAPSVDKVGRLFPVVAGARSARCESVVGWAAHCETQLFDAIQYGWSVSQLAEALGRWRLGDDAEHIGHWWVDGGSESDVKPVAGVHPVTLLSAMLSARELVV